jgi:hypothetical protein
MDPNAKGTALERATRAIEEMVIRSDPKLAQASFSIETRARIPVGELSYEFDVLVRMNEGTNYSSIHVFECKNWSKPVDRPAVTIFADKMRRIGAARGTIVARSFTRDATLQAKETPHLELVPFDDDIWIPLGAIQASGISHHFTRLLLTAIRFPDAPDSPEPNWLTAIASFNGEIASVTSLAQDLARRYLAESGAFRRPEGDHNGTANPTFEFGPGELTVGGWPIKYFSLDFDYSVSLRPARLVSTFSIEKRGRFARFECEKDSFDGTEIAIEVVGKLAASG